MCRLICGQVNSLLFRLRDAQGLHDKIQLLLRYPELIPLLGNAQPLVKTIAADAAKMIVRYERV